MGQLVFQATLGGQVNLVGPNTASTYNINVPAVAGNMVTTGDTGTVSSTMLASSLSLTTPNINVATGTSLKVSAGFYSTSSSSFTYTDGIVMDYTTGLGRISVGTSDGLAFYNAGVATTELMRIDSSGNLLVGTTDASRTASVGARLGFAGSATAGTISSTKAASTNTDDTFQVYSTGAGAYRFYVDMGGTVHATSIVITAISDERLKENVRDIDTGLSTVMALKPRRYDWKEGKGLDKKNAAGFIAQEFETVFPDSVGLSKAGEDGIEYKNINYEELIPTLTKAIQEQQALIEQLRADVETLKAP
jgi:Chaperone of endosialidase